MAVFNAVNAWFGRIVDLIFGFDFFISYAHADGTEYPRTLVQRLERLGFRAFLDSRGYVAGTELNFATQRRVRMSKYLIVIGRPAALASFWVSREVKIFLEDRRIPIVIDVNRAMLAAKDSEIGRLLADRIYIAETLPALDGQPSQETLERLAASFKATRQETVRRRIVAITAASLGIIAAIAVWQYFVASDRLQLAIARQLTAQAQLIQGQDQVGADLALVLAAEAVKRRPSPEAVEVLREAADMLPPLVRKIHCGNLIGEVVFSSNSRLLAYGEGSFISVVSVATGTTIHRIATTNRIVGAVAFGRDGSLYNAGDGVIEKWDISSGRRLWAHPVEDLTHSSLAKFSPDARVVATIGKDEKLNLWNVETGAPIALEKPLHGPLMAFSADGKFIATSGGEQDWGYVPGEPDKRKYNVVLWDTGSGRRVTSREVPADDQVFLTALSPDGSYMLESGMDGSVRVVRVEDGREIARMNHVNVIMDVAISANGRFVGTVDGLGTLHIWTGADGAEIFRRPSGEKTPIGAKFDEHVVFSPDGKYFVTATSESHAPTSVAMRASDIPFTSDIWIWDADVTDRTGFQHGGKAVGHPFSPDGQYVAMPDGMHDDSLTITDMRSNRSVGHFAASGRIVDVDFACDGQRLVLASWDNNAYVLDRGGRMLLKLKHPNRVTSARLNCSGTLLLTGSDDKSVRLWHLPEGRLMRTIGFKNPIYSIALSRDGGTAVAIGHGVHIFSTGSGDEPRALVADTSVMGKGDIFDTAELSQDGRLIAMGSRDGNVLVLDAATGRVAMHASFDQMIGALAFNSDGKTLAIGSADGYLRSWDVTSGAETTRERMGVVPISAAAFVQDDALLMANLDEQGPGAVVGGRVRSWVWRPDDILAAASRHALRNLTREEWQRYVGDESYRPTFTGLALPNDAVSR